MPGDSCIMPWLVEHAANLLTLFELGEDGENPYQRLRGKKLKMELVEFGEMVLFIPLDIKKHGELEPRWSYGGDLGVILVSGTVFVGTEEGGFKTRTVRRRTEDKT